MPNSLSATGLTIQTRAEIVSEILEGSPDFPGMYQIYGRDINVDPNSPDGQLINIVAQAKLDTLQLLAAIYSSFDPDQAIGASLDERCAINGVTRRPGTYTEVNVVVTVSQALTIPGLDTNPNDPFTVSDSAGNTFVALQSTVFSVPGSLTVAFRASDIGAVSVAPNTLTNLVTVQAGVVSANNPTGATIVGTDEESDYSLRVRRAKAVALPSIGSPEGLLAGLYAVDGVTEARVFENPSTATDGNGVPAHSIWAVVQGGTTEDIADVIYTKRNMGCGMKGTVTLSVGNPAVVVKFDRPTAQNLWIRFNLAAITGSVDPVFVRNQLLALYTVGIGQPADASTIIALIKSDIAPNATISSMEVSTDGVSYTTLVNPTTVDRVLTASAARISINGITG